MNGAIRKIKVFAGHNYEVELMNKRIEEFIQECEKDDLRVKVENSYCESGGSSTHVYTYVLISAFSLS